MVNRFHTKRALDQSQPAPLLFPATFRIIALLFDYVKRFVRICWGNRQSHNWQPVFFVFVLSLLWGREGGVLRILCMFFVCLNWLAVGKGVYLYLMSILYTQFNLSLRQHRTITAWRLRVCLARPFSVIAHKNSLIYDSIPASFLCTLTKNLLRNTAHINCAVLPWKNG